jgi:integrase
MNQSCAMMALVDEYLEYRHRLGVRLHFEGWALRSFARYADDSGHRGPLTTELAVRWARLPADATPTYQARRLGVVRVFARHRAIFDPDTEIPPEGLLGPAPRRPTPHIYTEAELEALLAAARGLKSATGLRPRTYATLIGLLICTGLRISEALRLARDDIDWGQRTLMIRQTKFHKSRLVPLHPTTIQALESYARLRDRCQPTPRTEAFFVSERGASISYQTVNDTFVNLRTHLPGPASPERRAPRIHDIRHTFACRRLLRWYAEGVNLDHAILSLATYLGHTQVKHTYWYLSAIPDLFALAVARFEQFAAPDQGALS